MLSVNTHPHTHARTHARTHTLKHVYVLSSPGRPPETARSAQQSGVEPSARGPDQVQQVPVCGTSHLWPQSLRVDVRGPQADLRLQLHADQKWVPVQIMIVWSQYWSSFMLIRSTGPDHACQKSVRTGPAACWSEVCTGPDHACLKSVLVQLHADQEYRSRSCLLAVSQYWSSYMLTRNEYRSRSCLHAHQKWVPVQIMLTCRSEVGTGPDHAYMQIRSGYRSMSCLSEVCENRFSIMLTRSEHRSRSYLSEVSIGPASCWSKVSTGPDHACQMSVSTGQSVSYMLTRSGYRSRS